MTSRPRLRAIAEIDPEALATFQAGIRKRYSNEQIVAELTACAERLGRSPTMKEFAADPLTRVHPQTVIEHFGTWNAAKRSAGLVPRRFATREELLDVLRRLGEELGRPPAARDLAERRGRVPSKSLYWHTFGSLGNALREAGFDVVMGEERLERTVLEARAGTHRRSPSGRSTGCSSRGAERGRRFSSSSAGACSRTASTSGPTGRSANPAVSQAAAAIDASRLRQKSRSCGARTLGKTSSSTKALGSKRSLRATSPWRRATSDPSAISRRCSVTPQ
jgi:hypothetical protein